MVYTPTSLRSKVVLGRQGGVAYAAQESWVYSATIKVCTRYRHLRRIVTRSRTISFMDLRTTKSDIGKVSGRGSALLIAKLTMII
jgi:hypothetical protein